MTTSPIFDFSYFPTIETERCILRKITHDDADAMAKLYSDPKVTEFMIIDPPCSTREEAVATIDWMNGHFNNKGAARWAITLRQATDQLIGTIGFHYYDRDNRHTDIGYDLMREYWGQGIVTEATHAVVSWCFEHLNLHRIQADCTDGNIGSERVLLKLGFTQEGIWRESSFEQGRFVDIKQFGLLRREYMT